MQIPKYYVLYRTLSKVRTSETDIWKFMCTLNSFEDVKTYTQDNQDKFELRIIKGVELEFEEEVEELFIKQRIVKSRRLKNT